MNTSTPPPPLPPPPPPPTELGLLDFVNFLTSDPASYFSGLFGSMIEITHVHVAKLWWFLLAAHAAVSPLRGAARHGRTWHWSPHASRDTSYERTRAIAPHPTAADFAGVPLRVLRACSPRAKGRPCVRCAHVPVHHGRRLPSFAVRHEATPPEEEGQEKRIGSFERRMRVSERKGGGGGLVRGCQSHR